MTANVSMMEAMNILDLSSVPEGAVGTVPIQSCVAHVGTENLLALITMDVTHVTTYIQIYTI